MQSDSRQPQTGDRQRTRRVRHFELLLNLALNFQNSFAVSVLPLDSIFFILVILYNIFFKVKRDQALEIVSLFIYVWKLLLTFMQVIVSINILLIYNFYCSF